MRAHFWNHDYFAAMTVMFTWRTGVAVFRRRVLCTRAMFQYRDVAFDAKAITKSQPTVHDRFEEKVR
jgi:hypothetical protein